MTFFAALAFGPPALGLVTHRWSAVLLPLIAWPAYYVGLRQGWWGAGTGDGWQVVAVAVTIFGLAMTALAVLLGRIYARSVAGRS